MYSNDDLLPNLPLPTLEETFSRLYDSAVPFGHCLHASVDGGNKSNDMKDSFVRECCNALADAQAVLQARSDTQVNWLGGWWEEFAYHRPRYPVAINTNTMAARLVDVGGDALSESEMWSNGNRCDNNKKDGNKNSGGIAPPQLNPVRRPFAPVGWDDALSRAALCIRESLHFRVLMMQEAVEEVIRPPAGLLLCQDQFRKYYAMRVPRIGKDEIVMPAAPGDTEFAVLMFRGRMAFLRVANRGVQAPLLNLAEIRAAVRCAVDAMKQEDEEDAAAAVSAPPAERTERQLRHSVGLLTCAGRDEAATGFGLLRAASERNVQYLHKLYYHTLTIVSIDDDPTTSTIKTVAQALRSSAVEQPHNRWYDRATSQIVSANGVASYQGEHSPMDAIVCACTPVEVVTSFAAELMETAHRLSTQTCATPATLPHQSEFTIPSVNRGDNTSGSEAGQRQWSDHVDVCRWVVPPQCQEILVRAYAYHQAVAGGCSFYALSNNGRFGRAALSKHRVHADFFCQLAIQLAYAIETTPPSRAATSVELAATYESASTRAFRQGRTETVRSATQEMKTLIQLLMASFQRNATAASAESNTRNTPGDHSADIRRAFQAAQRKHLQLVKEASTGAGVDRHLMGLRIAQTAVLQRPMPSVLQQGPAPSKTQENAARLEGNLVKAIKKAETFVLLTSQMVGDTYLGGFAHVSPVGYGVCYYPLQDTIRACVSSFAPLANVVKGAATGAPPTTDATRFGESVLRCMDELYDGVVIGKFATNSSRL